MLLLKSLNSVENLKEFKSNSMNQMNILIIIIMYSDFVLVFFLFLFFFLKNLKIIWPQFKLSICHLVKWPQGDHIIWMKLSFSFSWNKLNSLRWLGTTNFLFSVNQTLYIIYYTLYIILNTLNNIIIHSMKFIILLKKQKFKLKSN